MKYDFYEKNRLNFIVRLDYLIVLMRLFCALKRKKCQNSQSVTILGFLVSVCWQSVIICQQISYRLCFQGKLNIVIRRTNSTVHNSIHEKRTKSSYFQYFDPIVETYDFWLALLCLFYQTILFSGVKIFETIYFFE